MRTLRTFFITAITSLLLVNTAIAASNDQQATSQLSKLLDQSQSMTGNFTQVTLDATGTRLQETKGELALKRPGLFRWHTAAPQEQLLISDNQKLWLYDPDLMQLTIQKMDQRMSHTPALLLSGNVAEIQKNFTINAKTNGKLQTFILTPKDKDSLFNSLTLTFNGNTINSMQLIDNVGQKTNIAFKDIKMNAPVAASLFKFVPPQGTDIIEE
ncbi:outer membrane lipoprotein chaperone LolA [Entomomonas moraniae]|uniref:Outer-membrane lipoprotein carrier protein n=1 Tax=Entomomonas moraniae TaxID=2213226 RepID=A0A3S9XE97_9GAMM|nr:outer membrane lipoprotein chaperone LolA [Entomomonas moraniae]AZS50774.1 outer membrane lipoprotein chaperone LolA [Entomomonas moraniae]